MLKSFVVFDFDFTLVKTIEKIWVWSPRGDLKFKNKKYFAVHPRDITNIASDETIDDNSFKEFFDINIPKSQIIKPTLQHLLYYTEICKENITILTARPQSCENKIIEILRNNGLTTDINVVGLQNSNPYSKIDYINQKIDQYQYDMVIVYEDNLGVIDLIKEKVQAKHIEINFVKNLHNLTKIEYMNYKKNFI